MSSHFLVDKSLVLEAGFAGYAPADVRAFPEPGVEAHYGPDRGFVLEHVAVRLEIDPRAPGLLGEATLGIAPLPVGLEAVVLDLDEVEVSSVTDGHGEALPFRHADGKLQVEGVPVTGGVVVVRYSGLPTRGLYFTGPNEANPGRQHMAWSQCQDEDGHRVFPCVDHPSVKCPFTATIVAPDGFEVVGNGALAGKAPGRDGRTEWRWEQAEPMPAYLFTVVVAELTVVEDRWGELPLRYLGPRDADPATLRRVFAKTPAMVALFAERFGRAYPWPRYDQVVVHDFIFGGMENVAATTLTDYALTDERASLDWDADYLVAHELAHQWFGDLVTCADWSQAWLNEGWATYSEFVWATHDRGAAEGDHALMELMGGYLTEDGERYRRSVVHYRYRNPIDLFDRHLYEKGALVLHTLRTELGDAGFWAGTAHYLSQHAHGTVHTRDFQRAMEQATGRNLDRFFQQWVEGAGHPEVEVSVSVEGKELTVSVKQKQSGEGVAGTFHFPLHVAWAKGEVILGQTVLKVGERERTWVVPLGDGATPDRVEVDSSLRVLADLQVSGSRSLLVESLRHDSGIVGRIRAARALSKDGSPAALRALCEALQTEPFWGVRAEIAQLLARTGGTLAREALLASIGDEHPKARRAIVNALGCLRHAQVAAALERLVRDGDPSVQVEGAAVKAFAAQRTEASVQMGAMVMVRASWGETIRCRALEGLGTTRDPAALPHLLAWTAPSRDTRARAAAAAALGRLAQEVEGCRREAVDTLVDLVREAPLRVRLAAIGALGSARDPRAAAILTHVHESDGDGRVARMAYEALQRLSNGRGADDAVASLRRDVETLRDDNRRLRERITKVEDAATATKSA